MLIQVYDAMTGRSAALLQAHAAKSKQDMTAFEKYDQPRLKVVVTPNKQALGKTFKRQAKAVQDALEQMQVSYLPLHHSF